MTEEEYKELIKKITEEKLNEFINKAKEYYNAQKERDEEINEVRRKIYDEAYSNFSNINEEEVK